MLADHAFKIVLGQFLYPNLTKISIIDLLIISAEKLWTQASPLFLN